MPESKIKKDIIAYLSSLKDGCFMTRLSGSYRGVSGGRVIKAGMDGAGDIIGAYRGLPIAIETKRPLGPRGGVKGATQRASQIAFEIKWERAGGIYILARSDEYLAAELEKRTLGIL